ncbi:MAG: KpsF/GutQ family sugar-phosphate isomerase [Pseudomonadota bacterium]
MSITLDPDYLAFDYLSSAKRTLEKETQSLIHCTQQLDESFTKACHIMLNTHKNNGRIIVTGMGKSGHIGNKIAATLASTGTPALFLHPGEASHGDLGMVTPLDTILALSNSGSSSEIQALIPLFKRMNIRMIAITSNDRSPLANAADVHLNSYVTEEACPLDLAPTSSTTVCLALGDALAIALLEANGFSANDFAFSHPGGALGRKLLIKVKDLMYTGNRVPRVAKECSLPDALLEISHKGLGMTTIMDDDDALLGVFTDGDLRRLLERNEDIREHCIGDVMHSNSTIISPNALAAEALNIMEEQKITSLVVLNDDTQMVSGILHMHALLQAGIT